MVVVSTFLDQIKASKKNCEMSKANGTEYLHLRFGRKTVIIIREKTKKLLYLISKFNLHKNVIRLA